MVLDTTAGSRFRYELRGEWPNTSPKRQRDVGRRYHCTSMSFLAAAAHGENMTDNSDKGELNKKMNRDRRKVGAGDTKTGTEHRIDSVERVGDSVEIVVETPQWSVSEELSVEAMREYRDSFGVRRYQQFEGQRVVVIHEREADRRYIGGPA